ncbi:2-dehydropantoate 2-reductase [Dactylosporangium sp. NPDC050688]|uniref:ketopantoate reductase family protein n=1 Tax=Dactylosporangium sp. NPDC050688 TaxID=3157217 RepID=UPI00340B5686
MNVWVIGTGGLGRVLAGYLHDPPATNVLLVPVRGTSVDGLASGLTVFTPERTVTVRPPIVPLSAVDSTVGRPDVVLLCVKGDDTERAVAAVAAHVHGTLVVTPQNGLQAYRVADWLPGTSVAAAVMAFDGTALDGGRAVQRRTRRRITLGMVSGTAPAGLRPAATLLSRCAPVTLSEQIDATLWGKLVTNAAGNAVSAITRLTMGEVTAHPDLLAWCVDLMSEGAEVAARHGVRLAAADLLGIAPEVVRGGSTGPHGRRLMADYAAAHEPVAALRSSMCRDLDQGRPTEVAWINGEIVRHGDAVGAATILHQQATAKVRHIEQKGSSC